MTLPDFTGVVKGKDGFLVQPVGEAVRNADTRCSPSLTAGLTFAPDKSENGYRTRMTSFFKELGIDIILGVIPNGIE